MLNTDMKSEYNSLKNDFRKVVERMCNQFCTLNFTTDMPGLDSVGSGDFIAGLQSLQQASRRPDAKYVK
jgi:hypothetical protein